MQLSDLLPKGINPKFTASEKNIGNLKGAALALTIAAIKEYNQEPAIMAAMRAI